MSLLITDAFIVPMTATANESKYFKGNVGITENRIAFVEPTSDSAPTPETDRFRLQPDLKVLESSDKILMPGLINLHNHVAMTLMRGYADDMPLMPWLTEKIWPFEAKLQGDDIYLGSRLGIAEMLLAGNTTFVDMYLQNKHVWRAAEETGIRAVICPTCFEANGDQLDAEVAELIEWQSSAGHHRIDVRVAPHAPYTCPPDTIRKAVACCDKYGIGVHTHISETQAEQQTIRAQYGKTPTEYLRDLGLFEHQTLAAHCVYLNESDMDIMLQYGVSVSHNPHSNMKLASGIAPIRQMLEKGLNVGIGTDGPSSNNNLDMWEEMRTASLLQKVATTDPCTLDAYQTLQMVTVNGAKALGREGELGIIAPGAVADVLLLSTDRPHMNPCHDLIANLVYSGKASDVDTVIVDGEILVRDRQLTRDNLTELYDQVRESIARILARA